jgi:two-component system, chemotaxis family, protein-glutamate methylesterase/glutaminase
MTIRVLIIDDSATMRAILMSRLSSEPDISVIATASNAAEGRELIKQFDPDVVTLDIEMPGMNGLDFLEKIMTLRPTPVIVVSGATQEGNAMTARALALGAVDCYAKSDRAGGLPLDDNGKLASLVRRAAKVRLQGRLPKAASIAQRTHTAISADVRAIAIGSSTGGVEALQVLLRDFPVDCPPVLIVQHVNARFAPAIAQSLDEICPAQVVLAEPDMPLRRGKVYFAPGGDRHMAIGGDGGFYIKLRQGDPVSGHLPSVDVLFGSVAKAFGERSIGILLTGMGSDGAKGLLVMAQAGALTIAQDEATCTVFGMPRAAIALGAVSVVAPIGRIARHAFNSAA